MRKTSGGILASVWVMRKINSRAVKRSNATAPEVDNRIKAGISLCSIRPQWSTGRVQCGAPRNARGHKLLRRAQRSPHNLVPFLAWFTIPRLSRGSLPKGRRAGQAAGAPSCPQGG